MPTIDEILKALDLNPTPTPSAVAYAAKLEAEDRRIAAALGLAPAPVVRRFDPDDGAPAWYAPEVDHDAVPVAVVFDFIRRRNPNTRTILDGEIEPAWPTREPRRRYASHVEPDRAIAHARWLAAREAARAMYTERHATGDRDYVRHDACSCERG